MTLFIAIFTLSLLPLYTRFIPLYTRFTIPFIFSKLPGIDNEDTYKYRVRKYFGETGEKRPNCPLPPYTRTGSVRTKSSTSAVYLPPVYQPKAHLAKIVPLTRKTRPKTGYPGKGTRENSGRSKKCISPKETTFDEGMQKSNLIGADEQTINSKSRRLTNKSTMPAAPTISSTPDIANATSTSLGTSSPTEEGAKTKSANSTDSDPDTDGSDNSSNFAEFTSGSDAGNDSIYDRHIMPATEKDYAVRRATESFIISATRRQLKALANGRRLQQRDRVIDRSIVRHRADEADAAEKFDSDLVKMTATRDQVVERGVFEVKGVRFVDDKVTLQLLQQRMRRLQSARTEAARKRQLRILERMQFPSDNDECLQMKEVNPPEKVVETNVEKRAVKLAEVKSILKKRADDNFNKVLQKKQVKLMISEITAINHDSLKLDVKKKELSIQTAKFKSR